MNLLERIQSLEIGWRDAVDIVMVALIIYNILVLIRRTRAMPMAVGLFALGAAYFSARSLDLATLEELSSRILFYLPFVLIVLFQHEIRRALATLGQNRLLSMFSGSTLPTRLEEIVSAASDLARQRVGALIALERTEDLRLYTESGRELDAVLSRDLLVNIFTPNTPLHDGAVIVHRDRIVAAGCFLPLSSSTEIPADYGTRHRAALGLSEETDAVVIVISEENGSITAAVEGAFHPGLDAASLRAFLERNLTGSPKEES